MQIQPTNNLIFGYSNPLKTEWLKGNMPTVKRSLQGDILTKENVTLDHIVPKSKGGKSYIGNYVLETRENNKARGNDDILKYITFEKLRAYLSQFVDVKCKRFDGINYARKIRKLFNELIEGDNK